MDSQSTERVNEPVMILMAWLGGFACFIVPFLFVPGIDNFADFPKRVAVQLYAFVSLAILLIHWTVSRKPRILIDYSTIMACCFVLWTFFSLVYCTNRHEGLQIAMHWAACVAVFFVTQQVFRQSDAVAIIAAALCLAGCGIAVLGLAQYFFDISWVPQTVSPAATFANKNMAAQFIVLVWPLGLYWLLCSSSSLKIYGMAVMTALMALFVVFSGTRAAWVSLTVELVTAIVLLIREARNNDGAFLSAGKWKPAVLLSLSLVILIGVAGYKGKQAREAATSVEKALSGPEAAVFAQPDNDTKVSSTRERLVFWSNALAMFRDHPLQGVGVGNFQVNYPLYYRSGLLNTLYSETSQPQNVHNDYVQIAAELGLIGCVLLVGFACSIASKLASLLSGTTPLGARRWSVFLAAAMVGGAVNALFSFPMQLAVPPFVLMTFSGIAAGLWAASGKRVRTTPGAPVLVLILVSHLAIGSVLVRYHYIGFKARHHQFNAKQMYYDGRWPQAIAEGRKTLSLMPGFGIMHSFVGVAQLEMGRYREAAEEFDLALRYFPNAINILKGSGVAHSSSGNTARAVEVLRRYLRIKPDSLFVHELLATAYRRQGEMEAAFAELLAAADLDPEEGRRYIEVGRMALEYRLYHSAGKAFERAVRLRPEWGSANYYLGMFHSRYSGDKELGLKYLQEALEQGLPQDEEKQAAAIVSGMQ